MNDEEEKIITDEPALLNKRDRFSSDEFNFEEEGVDGAVEADDFIEPEADNFGGGYQAPDDDFSGGYQAPEDENFESKAGEID